MCLMKVKTIFFACMDLFMVMVMRNCPVFCAKMLIFLVEISKNILKVSSKSELISTSGLRLVRRPSLIIKKWLGIV